MESFSPAAPRDSSVACCQDAGPARRRRLLGFSPVLAIIDEARWDEVPLTQIERPGPGAVRIGRSPTESRLGGDYLCIDPATGNIVDQWTAKRRGYGMYDGDFPHLNVQAHCASTGGTPRTFAYVNDDLSATLPEPTGRNPLGSQSAAQAREQQGLQEMQGGSSIEVIVISDDDIMPMETTDATFLGEFVRTMVPMGAPPPPSEGKSRWWSDGEDGLPSVHTDNDVTEWFYGTSYGPVQYSPQAYNVIVRLLDQVMAEPVDVREDTTVVQLSARLSRSLRGLFDGLRCGDRHVAARLLGPDRTFLATIYFGLADIQVVHEFLRETVTPPSGGFAITVGGIRQHLLAHARLLRPPTKPPPLRRVRDSPRGPRLCSRPR